MRIDIVIVNWNSGAQLSECITSVQRNNEGLLGQCVVVDNGSTDGSTAFLAGAQDLHLIEASDNLGFARACNLGARHGDSPFLLFLNPDACLLPGSLAAPLAYLRDPDHAAVGIVGVQLADDVGTVQRTCARAPTPGRLLAKSLGLTAFFPSLDFKMLAWDHATTRPVNQVMGAFFMIRRDLFDALSGFDERFFVYFEEVDLSRRAAAAGFGTVYLTGAQVYHKGGGVSEQVKAHRLFYSLRSRIQYAFKHFSRPAAIMVAAATLVVEPLSRLALLLARGRIAETGDLARGYRMLWYWVIGRDRKQK